jgi:hypothetical protein
VFGGLNRLLATAAVAVAVFVVPSTALASGCGGGPSAEQVYKECVPNGGGGKSTSGAKGGPSTSGGQTGSTPVTVSPQVAKAIKKAGKDGKSLQHVVNAFGVRRHLQSSHATAATEPTAIGSAFDLGSGPTALLIILAGTAFLLLGGSGMRVWRSRHRQ